MKTIIDACFEALIDFYLFLTYIPVTIILFLYMWLYFSAALFFRMVVCQANVTRVSINYKKEGNPNAKDVEN
jgi:hypothetical protein